jgi:hypothetical protein
MIRQTKTKFQAITQLKVKVIDRSEPMQIDEARKYAEEQARKMRADHDGEWSVYLQCAIFEQDDQN